MVEIFNLDKDAFLNGILFRKLRYEGKFNNLKPSHKYTIIDLLVHNVKYGSVKSKRFSNSVTGLVLIFEATFKALNARFIDTLAGQFGWDSDEFINTLILHMCDMIMNDYRCKGERVKSDANFNRYICSKLRSKALCILSKEKIYRKHKKKLTFDAQVLSQHGGGFDRALVSMQFGAINKVVKQDLQKLKDKRERWCCKWFLDGASVDDIVKDIVRDVVGKRRLSKTEMVDINETAKKFVSASVRKFRERCRVYFAPMKHLVTGEDRNV